MVNPCKTKCSIAGENIAMCGYLFVYMLLPFWIIFLCDERIIIYPDNVG